ncbi:hypothetical protein HYR69_09575 [Candidatus Sumerlaeota bacterium]|nr:hypothetical protein [Candidatus Sumerlaeota bacterium]
MTTSSVKSRSILPAALMASLTLLSAPWMCIRPKIMSCIPNSGHPVALDTASTIRLQNLLDAGPPLPKADSFKRGIALGLHSKAKSYDYGDLMREISDQHADWISLCIHLGQENGSSEDMRPGWPGGWEGKILQRTIEEAHELGLKVMIVPIVLLKKPRPGEWRGNIAPASREEWFGNYQSQLRRCAETARQNGVEALSIGSELSSMEESAEPWHEIIAFARSVYPGILLYSANWDHYRQVPFWDDLDAIGISGYYELAKSHGYGLDELERSWESEKDALLSWRSLSHPSKKIVFTEIGYANQQGAAIHPWDYTRDAPPNPAEQALCYEAFIRAWHGHPELDGVFFYDWFGTGGPADTSYSPRCKPAALLIKIWYGRLAQPGVSLNR